MDDIVVLSQCCHVTPTLCFEMSLQRAGSATKLGKLRSDLQKRVSELVLEKLSTCPFSTAEVALDCSWGTFFTLKYDESSKCVVAAILEGSQRA